MQYVVGDLSNELEFFNFDLLVHGCNSQGVMGAGVALLVANKYPHVFEDYVNDLNIRKGLSGRYMGTLTITAVATGKHIASAITQDGYGRVKGNRYVSYDAIDEAFRSLADREISQNAKIGYPMIGAGLGGGNWDTISSIIDHRLSGLDHYCIVRPEDVLKYSLANKTQRSIDRIMLMNPK